jgi:hypothetical protein
MAVDSCGWGVPGMLRLVLVPVSRLSLFKDAGIMADLSGRVWRRRIAIVGRRLNLAAGAGSMHCF